MSRGSASKSDPRKSVRDVGGQAPAETDLRSDSDSRASTAASYPGPRLYYLGLFLHVLICFISTIFAYFLMLSDILITVESKTGEGRRSGIPDRTSGISARNGSKLSLNSKSCCKRKAAKDSSKFTEDSAMPTSLVDFRDGL